MDNNWARRWALAEIETEEDYSKMATEDRIVAYRRWVMDKAAEPPGCC